MRIEVLAQIYILPRHYRSFCLTLVPILGSIDHDHLDLSQAVGSTLADYASPVR